MKHWPSFEAFEEADETNGLPALWPSVSGEDNGAASEVPVDPEPPASEAAQSVAPPAIGPADVADPPSPSRGARFSPTLLLASLVVHAVAIGLAAHFLTRPGVEAQTDAVSVEIVVDATPDPNTESSLAGAAAEAEQVAKTAPTETPQSPAEPSAKPAAEVASKPTDRQPVEMTRTPSAVPRSTTPAAASPSPRQPPNIEVPAPLLALPSEPPEIKPAPRAEATAAPNVEVPAPSLVLPSTPPPVAAPKVLMTTQAAEAKAPVPSFTVPDTPPPVDMAHPAQPAAEPKRITLPAPAMTLPTSPPMFEPAPKATAKVKPAEVATTAPPPAEGEQPTIALPDQAPLPEPAPDRPGPQRAAENTTPDSKAKSARTEAKRVERRKAEEIPAKSKARYDDQPARQPSPSGVGNAPGRGSVASHGGASAGEKAAYAARLNSHVRRFERYPPEAERQGITGSARILITIDRSGRLVSSRLAGSAGSEILDAAARDTASRASPYPPPPDGIGGSTLTFAATIRFRR